MKLVKLLFLFSVIVACKSQSRDSEKIEIEEPKEQSTSEVHEEKQDQHIAKVETDSLLSENNVESNALEADSVSQSQTQTDPRIDRILDEKLSKEMKDSLNKAKSNNK